MKGKRKGGHSSQCGEAGWAGAGDSGNQLQTSVARATQTP